MNQRVARLEQDVRQPRLAMKADGPADTKTREYTESAAKQFKQITGIAVLQQVFKTDRRPRLVSA